MVTFPKAATLVGLGFFAVGGMFINVYISTRIFSKHLEAEERLRIHEWYLGKLVSDRS